MGLGARGGRDIRVAWCEAYVHWYECIEVTIERDKKLYRASGEMLSKEEGRFSVGIYNIAVNS